MSSTGSCRVGELLRLRFAPASAFALRGYPRHAAGEESPEEAAQVAASHGSFHATTRCTVNLGVLERASLLRLHAPREICPRAGCGKSARPVR